MIATAAHYTAGSAHECANKIDVDDAHDAVLRPTELHLASHAALPVFTSQYLAVESQCCDHRR